MLQDKQRYNMVWASKLLRCMCIQQCTNWLKGMRIPHMRNVIDTLHAYSFRASTSVNRIQKHRQMFCGIWNHANSRLKSSIFCALCPSIFIFFSFLSDSPKFIVSIPILALWLLHRPTSTCQKVPKTSRSNGSCFRNGFQGSDRHPCDTWPFSRRNASQHPGTKVTSHLEPATRCAKRSCESPHDHNGQWVPGLIWWVREVERERPLTLNSSKIESVDVGKVFSQMCPY